MRLSLFAALSSLLPSALAVFADEAYNVDYHYALLGQPKDETTFFHQPNPESKASLIYTLSEKGVLGAVNPRDGAVVWRQRLAQDIGRGNASFLRAAEGQDVVVAGLGSRVSAWSAADGKLVWDHEVSRGGQVVDVEVLAMGDGSEKSVKDSLVMASGESPMVQRLDGENGKVKWQYQLDGTDAPYQVSASTTEVFAIMLHKTMLGYYKIQVISLDPVTGKKNDEYTLSSENELTSPETIISVGANSASPIIAWTDATYSTLKVNIIGTKSIASFNIDKHEGQNVERVRIRAPYHTNSLSHFLVQYETAKAHWAEVYHVDLKKSKITQAYALPKVAGKGVFSTSTSDANVYFTRITDSEVLTVSSASHGVLGRWPLSSFGVVAGPGEDVHLVSAVSEVSIKGGTVSAIRSAVALSTGDWVLLRDGKAAWQRPEALADTISAAFTTPSAVEEFVRELELEAHSNFVSAYMHRIKRHLSELQRLPAFLAAMPGNIIGSFLGTGAGGSIASDSFGYHKVVACATETGRVVALDAGDASRILWSRSVSIIKDGAGALVSQPKLESCPGIFEVWDETTGRGVSVSINATSGETLSKGCPPLEAVVSQERIQYTMQEGALEAIRPSKTGAGSSMWHFVPSAEERIISLVPRPVNNPVASIGKVLGDRRVLYKYLDTNIALLATANDAQRTATFYILNTVSGGVLHSATHPHLDLAQPISTIISENWFAYSYTALPTDNNPKGHQLVVGEMFESLVPNDRGPLATQSNFSSVASTTEPFTLTHTYHIPDAIAKLAVSSTKQGITSRHLLAYIPAFSALIGLPYSVLDPRRPVGRDPTKDEQGEGLMRYTPVIEFDPKWYLSHSRELMGLTEIVTTPALVESTSLVFGYGLDVFGTRVTPSGGFDVLGQGFNKFQMLATVAGLFVATAVVGPLVTRRQVNARWQFA